MMNLILSIALALAWALAADRQLAPTRPQAAAPPKAESTTPVLGPAHQGNAWLRTQELRVGEGREVKLGDLVTVHFQAETRDGRDVADTWKRGLPFSFVAGANKTIRAFETGVIGMKPGGVRLVDADSEFGYGAAGAPPIVPPNAALRIKIYLIKVDPNPSNGGAVPSKVSSPSC